MGAGLSQEQRGQINRRMEALRTDVNDGIANLRNIDQNWQNARTTTGNMYERANRAVAHAAQTGSATDIADAHAAVAEMNRAESDFIGVARYDAPASRAVVMATARDFVDAARATGNNNWQRTAVSDYAEAQRQADRMDFIRNFEGSLDGQVGVRDRAAVRERARDLPNPYDAAVAAAPPAPAPPIFRDVPRGTQNIITSNNIEEGNNMVTWGQNLLLDDPRYYKRSTFERLNGKLDPFTRQPIRNETRYQAHLVGGRHKKTRKAKARSKTSRRMRRFRK
jgi:hypothetical protein